jgi:hypothetical protein
MDPNDPKKLRGERTIARSFARMAATDDGKRIIAYLKGQIGWDEAGPTDPATESLQFWTGQRSVVKLVIDQTARGSALLADPNDTEE